MEESIVLVLSQNIRLEPQDLAEGVRIEIAIKAMECAADTPLEYAERIFRDEYNWWQAMATKYKFSLANEVVFDPYTGFVKVYEEVSDNTWLG